MEFIYSESTQEGMRALAARLGDELSQRPVLWLLSGGSNIPVSVDVMRVLPEQLQPNLTIALTDERYGAPNHPDSNWLQLTEAGFQPGNSKIIPVLSSEARPLAQVVASYEKRLKQALDDAGIVIGQFGIGADGHTAGILQHSSAVADENLVCGYQAPDFARITLTPSAIRQVNAAYIFAFGAEKQSALEDLRTKEVTVAEQPAQLLKEINEVRIYTDQKEKA